MSTILLYSLLGGLLSLTGGILLLWRTDIAKRFSLPLLVFSAGAFLGASFLDILPEALEMGAEPKTIMISALTGFVIFFAIERLFMRYVHDGHSHEHVHTDHTESLPFLLVLGDSLHNFLDGILIALAYLANPSLGLVTTLAVAAHEVPQEIGDFSVLLNQGWSKKQVLLVNIFQSLLTVVGAAVGYFAGKFFEPYLPGLLAAAAGIFIYIAASDLIPEIHHSAGHKNAYPVLITLLVGILTVGLLSDFAHQQSHEGEGIIDSHTSTLDLDHGHNEDGHVD